MKKIRRQSDGAEPPWETADHMVASDMLRLRTADHRRSRAQCHSSLQL